MKHWSLPIGTKNEFNNVDEGIAELGTIEMIENASIQSNSSYFIGYSRNL